MTPQYIVLTVTRVATKNRNNPRTASANILNPPVRQLFILPMSILKAQHGESSEAEVGDGTLLSFAEHFEDVVEAINFASTHMRAVARPVQRQAINAAGQHVAPEPVSPLKRLADEMRDGTANFVQPSEAEKRAAEGAKHQDEPVWDDFVQTGGENVGAPAKRQPVAGDLQIVQYDGARWWIEIFTPEGDGVSPERNGVPQELLPLYDTRDAAREAVKLAGYIRRLIED